MKKLLSFFLITVMLISSMVVPAFAEEGETPTAPTGTIIINNAEQGWTYYVVKAFDAHVQVVGEGTDAKTNISYSIDKSANEALYNLIAGDKTLNAGEKSEIKNPFQLHMTNNPNVFEVTHKTPGEGQGAEFGRGWLYGWYGKTEGWNLAASDSKTVAGTEYNVIKFENLPYGYYVVYKAKTDGTRGSIASVVTLSSSQATIFDKNPRTPGDSDKKIVLENGGMVKSAEYSVGDVVKYQSSFMATNYRTYENPVSSKQIDAYYIRDDATGLKYKSLDKMTIYTTKNADGTFSGPIKSWTWPTTDGKLAPYTADATYGGYSMKIDWVKTDADGNPVKNADGSYTSLYPSPCYVVLEYQMYLTEAAINTLYNNTGTNTFTPSFKVGESTVTIPNPPSAKVYTSGLSIAKTDANKHVLEGAMFKLSKVESDGSEKFYSTVQKESELTREKWLDVEWVSENDETVAIKAASNNPDEQSFFGLTSGTYRLYEVETPEGFKFPGFPYWEIKISFDAKKETYSATIKQGPNGEEKDLPLVTSGTGENAVVRKYFLTSIVNEGGTPLPQTGAAGTTRMLIAGGSLFAITMLVLVTKKRLYNQG